EPADHSDYEGLADAPDLVPEATGAADRTGVLLGGHSMGCHTVARPAVHDPDGARALILIGPVVTGSADDDSRWDQRAAAVESGGPEAFAELVAENSASDEIRETTFRLARDRARPHRHPEAVAAALREVPRSKPFEDLEALAG